MYYQTVQHLDACGLAAIAALRTAVVPQSASMLAMITHYQLTARLSWRRSPELVALCIRPLRRERIRR